MHLLAQRGIEASYETIRCWTLKFGRAFAQNLRRCRPRPIGRWHLDEIVVKIRGQRKDFSRLTPRSTATSTCKDT
jgi:transposase-like protein